MGLFLFSRTRLIVCLYLFYEASGLNKSATTPVNQIEEVFDCTDTYYGKCCTEDEFQCQDGSCIPLINACDTNTTNPPFVRKTECNDLSDEYGCSQQKCSSRKPPCQYGCTDLPNNRSRCYCNDGYTLKKNSDEICEDVNECELDLHTCSHTCINLEGSYDCACHEGFKLDNTKGHWGSCKPDNDPVLILFNSNHWIYAYDLKRRETREFVPAGKVSSMDYDPVTDMIYWWNEHLKTLSRSYLPGNDDDGVTVGHEQKLCVTSHENALKRKSVAVDWSLGNLYWIFNQKFKHTSKSGIMLSKLEGTPMKTLFYRFNVTITSMVIDPPRAKMYWAVSGKHSNEIDFSDMHGKSAKPFVLLKDQHAIALTLDQGYGVLYWFDTKSSSIYTARKEGAIPKKVRTIHENRAPHSMDVFGDHLYWISKPQDLSRSGKLMRYDKHGRGNIEILFDNLVGESSVKVYHKNKYKDYSVHDWDSLREKCHRSCKESLCIRTHRGFQCLSTDSHGTSPNKICLEKDLSKENKNIRSPLMCKCKMQHWICNKNSPYHECHCKLPCQNHSSTIVQIMISGIVMCMILTCFVLSFYKRRITVIKNKSIQMQEVK